VRNKGVSRGRSLGDWAVPRIMFSREWEGEGESEKQSMKDKGE
jgi:hypothetical protein